MATSAVVPKNLYPNVQPTSTAPDPAMMPKPAPKPATTATATASTPTPTAAAGATQGQVQAPTMPSYPNPTLNVPGLINVQPSGGQPTVTAGDHNTYTATPDVVGANETVQDQVNQIIKADSPLMQQAALRAREESNARGMLNSSMAVGAGQQAVISAALPIAQQDANTYAAARQQTNQSINAANQFNAGNLTNMDLANLQAETQMESARENNATNQLVANLNAMTALTQSKMTQDTQVALAAMDTNTKMYLGKLDADNRQLLQTNASAAGMFQNVVDQIGQIARDTELSKSAKNDATQTQLNILNEALRTINQVTTTNQNDIASLDLSSFFIRSEEPTKSGAPAPASGLGTVGPNGSGVTLPAKTNTPYGTGTQGGGGLISTATQQKDQAKVKSAADYYKANPNDPGLGGLQEWQYSGGFAGALSRGEIPFPAGYG